MIKNNFIYFSAFNRQMLDPHLDFYLADTVTFETCKHEDHQKDMANIAPLEEMVKIIFVINRYVF